jgi:hypothetical protein
VCSLSKDEEFYSDIIKACLLIKTSMKEFWWLE